MSFVDPSQFIITRKRKKYRFALFKNSKLCFEFDEWSKKPADVVEVGAGTGLFSVELATRDKNKTFVAIDVKGDRLQKGAIEAENRGLENIFFVRARADQVEQLFTEDSVSRLWITFPDPFPKKRSAKRRMTHEIYLSKYRSILKNSGEIMLKHDDINFFCWSLEQLVANRWNISELTFDLHESEFDDYKIMTTYEKKWVDLDKKINFVKAKKR